MSRPSTIALAAAFLLLAAAPLAAQQKAAPAPARNAAARAANDPGPELEFDREVYSYPGTGRRDPFTPLVGKFDTGPRFEDLSLRGIIFSTAPGRSLALLADASAKKVYKVRRGDVVGNARVIEIDQGRVIFAVDNFGVVRQETLELKPNNAEGERE